MLHDDNLTAERPTFVTHLECAGTGERYEADRLHNVSRAGKPLLVGYDLGTSRSSSRPCKRRRQLARARHAHGFASGSSRVVLEASGSSRVVLVASGSSRVVLVASGSSRFILVASGLMGAGRKQVPADARVSC